jgi:hypothetical protein
MRETAKRSPSSRPDAIGSSGAGSVSISDTTMSRSCAYLGTGLRGLIDALGERERET